MPARYILTCFLYKFKILNKGKQLFKIRLKKYADYILYEYVNPNSIYMKYYVDEICTTSFGNEFEEKKNKGKSKIGYLSKNNKELKLITLKPLDDLQ